jgi:hypothetical protein
MLNDYAVDRRATLVLDRHQPRLDPGQPGGLGFDLCLNFGPPENEHAAKLGRAYPLVEYRAHLLESEAEVLQGDNAIQVRKLAGRIEAVRSIRIHVRGLEQPDLVVVTQHPNRDPAVPGKLSDAEHDPRFTASHGVRVKYGHLDDIARTAEVRHLDRWAWMVISVLSVPLGGVAAGSPARSSGRARTVPTAALVYASRGRPGQRRR